MCWLNAQSQYLIVWVLSGLDKQLLFASGKYAGCFHARVIHSDRVASLVL